MTTSDTARTYPQALRTLYLVRFGFAVIWAAILFAAAAATTAPNPLLTVLLILYPLFDAGAVLWQLRADPDTRRSKAAEWVNVAVSLAVAVALGIASSASISAALAVWGVWAIVAGVPQLIAAIRNRRNGGQVPQMLSGGISVFVGAGFLFQGLQGSAMIAGAAGYATLGAIFFLISAVRLSATLRRPRA
ncbi:DUF308 domain-containing protein [Microbacterium sp. XT11]|uniref:DUF308 domain-containing protein n=1 Tax=Microbacterium sp. XT11 TaxID=367477 RepID=UPI000742D50C|nr:DUF308 domain-containing protein [Microbacterium sp. XT11]ALX66347.1 integral membrane protein [Microbacterium sp. XT11]